MKPFTWRCPFCDHTATITTSNFHSFYSRFDNGNRFGDASVKGAVIVCPNSDCREFTLNVDVMQLEWDGGGFTEIEQLDSWSLRPESAARVFPNYIPAPMLQDYVEACLVVSKSPKSSATLARRCLQGMIRDFWQIKGKKNLFEEIDALEEKIEPETWDAIDALRKIGNIGAHMEKDINLIIDVDLDEASLLIQLIETLFEDWYIRRHERGQRMSRIKALAAEKDAQRKGGVN